MLLQLQINNCRTEQTSLMRQRNTCLVEKEACVNATLLSYVKNNDNIIALDEYKSDQKVILGILLFAFFASCGANIWCCVLCVRKHKRNSPQKFKLEYWRTQVKHLREIVSTKSSKEGRPQNAISHADLTISTTSDGTLVVESEGKGTA